MSLNIIVFELLKVSCMSRLDSVKYMPIGAE